MSFSLSPFRRDSAQLVSDRPAEHAPVPDPPDAPDTTDLDTRQAESLASEPLVALPITPIAARPTHVRRSHSYRVAVIVACVLAAAAATMLLAGAGVLSAIESTAAWLQAGNSGARRALVATGLLAAAALTLVVAWSRATAPGKPVQLAGGRGTIGVAEIAERLAETLEQHDEIRSSTVQVDNAHRRGVRVDVRVSVGPHTRIDGILNAVDDAAEALLHGQLGVQMDGLPLVAVNYDELRLKAGEAHD